jgi:putative sterol carrier protein
MVKWSPIPRRSSARVSRTVEIFERVERKLREKPGDFTEVGAVYKFVIDGPEGGTWIIDLRKETLGVRAADEDAECTVQILDEHFVDLFTGKLPPESALLSGKIKLTGNVLLAIRFAELLKR